MEFFSRLYNRLDILQCFVYINSKVSVWLTRVQILGGRGGFGDRGGRGGRGGGRGAPRGRGGRGGGRGGAAGAKGGAKVIIEPHRHAGVFVARGGKEDLLVTKNLTPGEAVYGEKRISVEAPAGDDGVVSKVEYRVWNPFRSKLAAGILGGLDNVYIKPGAKG